MVTTHRLGAGIVALVSLAALDVYGNPNGASCDVDSEGNCKDLTCDNKYPDCDMWAGQGQCKGEGVRFMVNFCKKACNICDFNGNLTQLIQVKGDVELLETPFGVQQNVVEGEFAERTREKTRQTAEYVRDFRSQPQFASVHHACRNLDRSCSYWSVIGECETNQAFMSMSCGPACQTCHLMDYNTRCPTDPNVPMALAGPGELNQLFQRIADMPQFDPRVLSMPNPTNPDIQEGPWVIVLDNFLPPTTADRLAAMGADIGYMDSGKFIADQKTGGRTSQHTWCKTPDQCMDDIHLRMADARIEYMTGIPMENFEYFQLLRYDLTQYYRTHNDYNPIHKNKQTGVRLMTVFLYLNDCPAGGGTNFPKLNLTVTPKKGRAVIWPSVLDEDPNERDERTDHQALPVEEGLKFGANVWIHQREYRKGHLLGCSM